MINRAPGSCGKVGTRPWLRARRLLLTLLAVGTGVTLTAQESSRFGPPATPVTPVVEKHVMPVYPPIAISGHVQGIVIVEVTIAPEGRVAATRVIRSIPVLEQAALDVVRQWQFAPRAETSAMTRMITFNFVLLAYPETYRRPAQYMSPLPSWIPPDFAWTYRYECRGQVVAIDSIDRAIVISQPSQTSARTIPFPFETDDAADGFVMLVAGGYFDPETNHRLWKERAGLIPGVQQRGDQIVVTVTVAPPPMNFMSTGLQTPRGDEHVLSVRRGDTWRVATWFERKGTPAAATLPEIGRRLREFVQKRLSDPRQVPVC